MIQIVIYHIIKKELSKELSSVIHTNVLQYLIHRRNKMENPDDMMSYAATRKLSYTIYAPHSFQAHNFWVWRNHCHLIAHWNCILVANAADIYNQQYVPYATIRFWYNIIYFWFWVNYCASSAVRNFDEFERNFEPL